MTEIDITSLYLNKACETAIFTKDEEVASFKKFESLVAGVMRELECTPSLRCLVRDSVRRLYEDEAFLASFVGQDSWESRDGKQSALKWASNIREATEHLDSAIDAAQEAGDEDALTHALKLKHDALSDIEITSRILKEALGMPEAVRARALKGRIVAERNKILQRNLRLVPYVAKKYSRPMSGISTLDLIQEGNIGMMRAIDRFDWRKGHKFSTYAIWWIRQSITRYMQEKCSDVRMPVHMKELMQKISKETSQFEVKHGRKPLPSELKSSEGASKESIRILTRSSFKVVSVNEVIRGTDDLTLLDTMTNPDALTQDQEKDIKEIKDHVMRLMVAKLTQRERDIIIERFGMFDGDPKCLQQIGEMMGVTRERIRQIEMQALNKMKHAALSDRWRYLQDL